jgi:hypothetical protein
LYGRTARRVQIERRATGDLVHVEHTSGVVTILPAWKLDAVYCASLKVGAPRVSLMALCALHEVLIACESRQVSTDGNIVTQETQDGIAATARAKDEACSEAGTRPPDITPPARPRSRRCAALGHGSAGTPSGSQITGSPAARGKRRRDTGGRR